MQAARVRRLANTLLPRPVVRRAASGLASIRRWRRSRRLDAAPSVFADAYASYWRTGLVPDDADRTLFLANWATGGTLPRAMSKQLGRPYDAAVYDAFDDDLLARLDPETAAAAVERDGCFVAPFQLSEDVVDDVLRVLTAGPAQPRGDGLGGRPPGRPEATAPTWWVAPEHSLQSESVRRLLRQRRLVDVAGRYLGVDPLVMSVVLWKSFPWPAADGNSAQQFHYDADRPAFLKMFVYLTDVTEKGGPHVYVAGSHGEKPTSLLHGERLSDDEVACTYPRESWTVITGTSGTVFFADTNGFHKGSRVIAGERAILQINLGSDRFGVAEAPIGPRASAPEDLHRVIDAAPRYFEQLFTSDSPVS